MKPHKWAKEIKAWADGAEIECSHNGEIWCSIECPSWFADGVEYRIKPKTRKAIIDGVEYEFPEPLNEKPEGVDTLWVVCDTLISAVGAETVTQWLSVGIVQLTKEGAEAQLQAERALRGIL